MPSGPKKRKAAKKKRENQHNGHSGEDDATKQLVCEEAEVGRLRSSASRVRRSRQKLSTDGGEEEIGKGNDAQDTEKPSTEAKDDRAVKADREFEIGTNEHDGGSEDDESMKKSWTGSSSEGPHSYSSSSSNSDDEGHDITDTQAKPDVAPPLDSSPEKSDEHPRQEVSRITQELGDSVVENLGPEDPSKCSLSGEEAVKDIGTPANNSSDTHAVEPVFNENKEKEQSSVEDTIDRKDEVFIQSTGNTVETDDKSRLPHTEPRTDSSNGVEREKLSGVTEPLLPPAQRPVQTTSWKNCCGLFELFSGSGR